MRLPRPSLGLLMAVAMVIAVDLAVVRSIYRSSQYFQYYLIIITPAGLILHLTALGAALKRGRSRLFWIGFLGAGVAAMSTAIMAFTHPQSIVIDLANPTLPGELNPGGLATRLWGEYLEYGYDKFKYTFDFLFENGGIGSILIAAPILAAGCGGGLLLRWAGGRRWGSAKSRDARAAGMVHD